jgi:hypothetical protein
VTVDNDQARLVILKVPDGPEWRVRFSARWPRRISVDMIIQAF